MTVEEGAEATIEYEVSPADTAAALGSGDVEVLATPFVVALCERAAVAALAGRLEPSQTTVGTRVSIDHVAPTGVGRRVVVHARLQRVEGRTLEFAVEAADPAGSIAHGTHVRMLVDRDRFLGSAERRA